MFDIVILQEAFAIAVNQGAGGDHFGVKQSIFAQLSPERPAVAVTPVHHWSGAKAAVYLVGRYLGIGWNVWWILYGFCHAVGGVRLAKAPILSYLADFRMCGDIDWRA